MSNLAYWKECISIALDEAGVSATAEQIELIADAVDGAHENYGMAHGHECIPDPREAEMKKIQQALDDERRKVFCKDCKGRGYIIDNYGTRSSESECWKCRGAGKHLP